MSGAKEDLDVNDAFDNLLFGEELAEKSGYEEGYEAGRTQQLEAYHLGYHRAGQLAAQLGYYSGVLESHLKANLLSGKAIGLAETLLKEIKDFPRVNDETVDILKSMENIKFKYIRLCSLAKISHLYPEAENLDF